MKPFEFNFAVPAQGTAADSMFHVRGTDEWKLRDTFLTSVKAAFSRKPDLASRLHGKRKVLLGRRGDSRPSLFPSKKNADVADLAVFMPVESRLEQAYALCLERQPNVIAYRTQAIEIAVPGKRSHWPDFLILDDQGRLLVRETKQDTAFLDKDYREKTDWVRGFLYRIGIDYAIVGRADLPTDRELQNLKVLHQSYTRLPGKFEIDHATAALPALLPCTYQALIEALGDVGKHLLFTGQLRIDWQKPFNMNSEVWK